MKTRKQAITYCLTFAYTYEDYPLNDSNCNCMRIQMFPVFVIYIILNKIRKSLIRFSLCHSVNPSYFPEISGGSASCAPIMDPVIVIFF